jgi:hypothetical protein
VTIAATSSGSNEALKIGGKGTGNVDITSSVMSLGGTANHFTVIGTTMVFTIGGAGAFSISGATGNTLFSQLFQYGHIANLVGWATPSSGVARLSNASTGAGQLLIGTSTDTADAQLSVYSQSTTRPSLKLRATGGTLGTINAIDSRDTTDATTFSVTVAGGITTPQLIDTANQSSIAGHILETDGNGPKLRANAAAYTFAHSGSAFLYSSTTTPGINSTRLGIGAAAAGPDIFLERDSANTLAQRNSTNAQRFNLGNTFTSASVREDLSFYWSSNVAHIGATTTGATARVLQLDFGGTTTAAISIPITSGAVTFSDGGVALGKTITAGGTTGDQTINKSSFTVNFAAAATAITVTNSLVTANSNIICTVQFNDTTMKSVVAAPGSGSVVLTANAAATAETRVGCVIHN